MSGRADKNEMYCNACIEALILANVSVSQATPEDLLRRRSTYGKKDTLAFDAIAEIQIKSCLLGFDPDSALITEEQGRNFLANWPDFADIRFHPSVFFSDPIDRSYYFAKFLEFLIESGKGRKKLVDLLADDEVIAHWGDLAENPASITGTVSAITCVRRGRIIFSVLLNYVTQELIVACSAGIKIIKLTDLPNQSGGKALTLEQIKSQGKTVEFNSIQEDGSWDRFKHFVTFLGGEGKTGYAENFRDSEILAEEDGIAFKRYKEPGGPARILYLSSLHLAEETVGFILANGEKITEWIHWLPFVRFASQSGRKTLRLFEISHARPCTKEGVLMSTSPSYSVFQQFDGMTAIDINFLRRFPNPSKYRSTLIVAPYNNDWVSHITQQLCYREIVFD